MATPYTGISMYSLFKGLHGSLPITQQRIGSRSIDLERSEAVEAIDDVFSATSNLVSFQDIYEYEPAKGADEVLEQIVEDFRASCMQRILWIDLSKREIGIPFVKVFVPSAELDPTSNDYVPGPRMMKWLRSMQGTTL
jgi:hypothetical protein